MPTRLGYALAAKQALQNPVNNSPTLVDLFDGFKLDEGNSPIKSFIVAGRLLDVANGPAEIVVKIEHEGSSGNPVATRTLNSDFVPGVAFFTANFSAVEVNRPGKYFIHVVYNNIQLEDFNRFYFEAE